MYECTYTYHVLVEKPEGNSSLGKPGHRRIR
jgi:hypothetical protein